MSCDHLWERKRSVLFQLGVEQEENGNKCMAGSKREGMKEAGPGDGLPDGEGKVHHFSLPVSCLVFLMGKDTCHIPKHL